MACVGEVFAPEPRRTTIARDWVVRPYIGAPPRLAILSAAVQDRDALLCEHCGYHLAGLASQEHCPECGLAISESLPVRRVGTPWQRRPSAGAWLLTGLRTLRHPISAWSRMRIEWPRSVALLVLNALLAAALLSGAAVWRFGGGPIAVILSTALTAMGLLLLTLIEWFGVRFFSNRRDWRLTPEVGWTICGHASIGWIFAGPAVGLLALGLKAASTLWPAAGRVPFFLIFAGGLFTALMLFETLVYIGSRRCKFANRPGVGRNPPNPVLNSA